MFAMRGTLRRAAGRVRERRSPAVARSGVRAAAGQLSRVSQAAGTAQTLSF